MPPGLIQLGLTLLGPWMTPFALYIDAYVASMDAFCGEDPPAMPNLSNFNPLDLLGGVFNPAFGAARQQLLDAFQNWLWYRNCGCTSGALVQQPVRVVPPPVSLGATSAGIVTPCFAGGWSGLAPQFIGGDILVGNAVDVTQQIVPVGRGRQTISSAGPPYTVYEMPPGLNSIFGSGFVPLTTTHLGSLDSAVVVQGYDTIGNFISAIFFGTLSTGGLFQVTSTIPAAWRFWHAFAYNNIQPGDPSVTAFTQLSTQVFCGTNLPGALQSCCPPDDSTANMLQAILRSIGQIPSAGGLPPGSYVDSVTHTGLTGLGSIPVQHQTVAARVVITTDNNQLPVGVGDPPYLFDRGFIVPIVSHGGVRGNVRLVYNPQLYVLPQLTEQIGYTLADRIVASIIELVPGP